MDSNKIQNYYKLGEQYFNQMGFPAMWKDCTDFKNGRQWAAKTEKTKNLPRPVINIIRFVENHKCSQILSEPIKMIFNSEEVLMDNETNDMVEGIDRSVLGAELFTEFSVQEWENIKQDDLNEEALDKASELGSGIFHYYFDNSVKKGKQHIVQGAMKGEILHPLSVMVGNPQCLDTQLQPYILIPVRDDVDNIKKRAKENGLGVEELNKIVGDKDIKDSSDNARYEVRDKATETTCYWKENDSIWLIKTCGDVITKKAIDTGHKLYPIARMNWYKEDKNWYGLGETEGLIANQKAINFMTAMQMMKEQMTGMPKLMLKKQYIKSFNNDPASPIYDSGENGWSAQYLQPAQQSGKGQELVDFLMTTSKTHSGATETASGELSKSSQMNATAIMMLQKASAVPLEQVKKRFKRTIEEVARIWIEFWTVNYNTARVINVKDENGEDVPQSFRGSDFKDIGLKTKVDVGASTEYSESLTMTMLDKIYDKGDIDLSMYAELAPEGVMTFKDELLKLIEAKKQETIQSLSPEEQQSLSMLPQDQQEMALQQLQQPQQPQQNQGGMM